MTTTYVDEWLADATKQLIDAGVQTARLDSLVLLEDMSGQDRSWLLAHPEYIISKACLNDLRIKITKRAHHVPLAYIRGKTEFYNREFTVNAHTLIPRPETETIIDLLKGLDLSNNTSILDIGTGSGCIAITIALELPELRVSACDIDNKCLEVASQNARTLGVNVNFFESNLLDQASRYNVLVANLPYVPDDFQINTAATYEPSRALFGGQDGLDLYRALFMQIKSLRAYPRYILVESLPSQHKALAEIAKVAGFSLRTTDDFIQLFELLA